MISDIAMRHAFDLWAGDGTKLTLQEDPECDLVLIATDIDVLIIELGIVLDGARVPDARLGIARGTQGWVPLFFENSLRVRRAAVIRQSEVVITDRAIAAAIATYAEILARQIDEVFTLWIGATAVRD